MAADFQTLQEMVQLARSHLGRGEWDYLIGAADSETTMKRNRLAFDRLALKARVMNDVSRVICSLLPPSCDATISITRS